MKTIKTQVDRPNNFAIELVAGPISVGLLVFRDSGSIMKAALQSRALTGGLARP